MLFSRRKNNEPAAPSLDHYARTVEEILSVLGYDPAAHRISTVQGYGWNFSKGSAIIEVYVSAQEDQGYIQVLSPIMHIPANSLLPLYRYLLELNMQLTNAALGVYFDVIYVFNERSLLGLDPEEVQQIINQVASYADDLDNRLVNEFGGRLYSQP